VFNFSFLIKSNSVYGITFRFHGKIVCDNFNLLAKENYNFALFNNKMYLKINE